MKMTSSAHIAVILKMFPRLSETFILNEILELEAQGVPVRIFSLRRPMEAVRHADAHHVRAPVRYVPQSLREFGGRILGVHWQTWRRSGRSYEHAVRHLIRHRGTRSFYERWLELSQACSIIAESQGAAAFHAHFLNLPAKIALLVHKITGIPYSVTTHAKDLFLNGALSSPHVQERLRAARFVVANSRYTAAHIAHHCPAYDAVHTIYNGINLRRFSQRAREPEEPLILAVGRLVEKKGFPNLVEACHILQQRGIPFKCDLVGTGPLLDRLKRQITDAGLRDHVRLVGPLTQDELAQRYEQALICTLPCIETAEGDRDILPNVLKEAMARGVVVVTSQLDGVDELVEHGVSGLLVPPSDSRALADCLQLLLTDAELRQRLTIQARKTIQERFDCRVTFRQLKQLLLQNTGLDTSVNPVAPADPVVLNESRLR